MQYSISLAPTAALGYFTEGIDLSGTNQQTEDGESDAPPAPSKVVGEWFLSSSTCAIVFPLDDDADFGKKRFYECFQKKQKGHPKFLRILPHKAKCRCHGWQLVLLSKAPQGQYMQLWISLDQCWIYKVA